MKKQTLTVLLLLLFSLIVPVALAEETDATPDETPTPEPTEEQEMGATPTPEVDDGDAEEEEDKEEVEEGVNPETEKAIVDVATEQEAVAFQLGNGAKVRLLQLEKSIFVHTIKGQIVIGYLKEKDANIDVLELETILAELVVLRDEVAAVNPDESEDAVKQFVDLKNDAMSLIKQFRDTSKELLSNEDRSELAQKFKDADWSELEALRAQIHELIKEYNSQRVENALGKLGDKAKDIANKIRNGEMKMNGVKAAVGKAMGELEPVQKNKAFQKMKEINAKKRVFVKAKILEAKKNFLERRVNRLETRIQAIKNNPGAQGTTEQIQDRIRDRIENPRPKPANIPPKLPVENGPGPAGPNGGNGGVVE